MLPILEHMLLRGALIGLRIAGVMSFAPFFTSTSFPPRIKAAFTFVLTALLYPLCRVPASPLTLGGWAGVVLSETIVGVAIGLSLQFIFEGVLVAGQVGGFQLGFSLVNVIDPQTNVETPVLSTFHQLFALLLFLQMNVHHWILRGIVKSFDYVPVGSAVVSAGMMKELFHDAAAMFLVGIQIAAPLLFATVVIDITVGFLSKASPQLPAILLSIPMKSLAGYSVLAIAIGLWPTLFERQFTIALGWSERLLHLAH